MEPGALWAMRNQRPATTLSCPGVLGEPTIYCVQVPSPHVVASRGGTGRSKHWGSPFGCSAVAPSITGLTTWTEDGSLPNLYQMPAAAFAYGEPLSAHDVIDMPWCSRCAGAAWNLSMTVKDAAKARELKHHIEERSERAMLRPSREITNYFGR